MSRQVETAPAAVVEGAGVAVMTEATRPPVVDRGLVAQLVGDAQRQGLSLLASDSPIQPLLCGDDATAVAMSAALENAGYMVTAIRPPTVPEGKARLRVTLSALHTATEVDALVEALARSRDAVQHLRGVA